jgi:hypothetical protein
VSTRSWVSADRSSRRKYRGQQHRHTAISQCAVQLLQAHQEMPESYELLSCLCRIYLCATCSWHLMGCREPTGVPIGRLGDRLDWTMAKSRQVTGLTPTDKEPVQRMHGQSSEEFELRAWIRAYGLSLKTRTAPRSSLSAAIATLLLVAAGCGCTVVLAAIGAPTWVKVGALLVPIVVFFNLLRMGGRRQ